MTKFLDEKLALKTVVLYSVSQDCFHIERLVDYVKSNIRCVSNFKKNDYKLIGIFNGYKDADVYIEEFRVHLDKMKEILKEGRENNF